MRLQESGQASNCEHTLGRGLINSQPDADRGDFDHGEVVGGELFVACCDAPELFEFVEETLDPVAQAVEHTAEGVVVVALLRSGMMGTASWASIIALIHSAS